MYSLQNQSHCGTKSLKDHCAYRHICPFTITLYLQLLTLRRASLEVCDTLCVSFCTEKITGKGPYRTTGPKDHKLNLGFEPIGGYNRQCSRVRTKTRIRWSWVPCHNHYAIKPQSLSYSVKIPHSFTDIIRLKHTKSCATNARIPVNIWQNHITSTTTLTLPTECRHACWHIFTGNGWLHY